MWQAYIPHFATFEREGLPLEFLVDYKNNLWNKIVGNDLSNESGSNSDEDGSVSDDMDVEEAEN